jgi:hypothetical protein
MNYVPLSALDLSSPSMSYKSSVSCTASVANLHLTQRTFLPYLELPSLFYSTCISLSQPCPGPIARWAYNMRHVVPPMHLVYQSHGTFGPGPLQNENRCCGGSAASRQQYRVYPAVSYQDSVPRVHEESSEGSTSDRRI